MRLRPSPPLRAVRVDARAPAGGRAAWSTSCPSAPCGRSAAPRAGRPARTRCGTPAPRPSRRRELTMTRASTRTEEQPMLLDPVPDEHSAHRTPAGPTPTRTAQARSGTQLPWKPAGTRCGSSITACASPSMSSALRMCRRGGAGLGRVHERQQPAVRLSGVVGPRHEDGLAQRWRPRPKERVGGGPPLEVVADEHRLGARRCRRPRRPRRRSRSGAAGPPGARRPAGIPGRGRRAAPPSPRCRGRRGASARASACPSAGPSSCVRNMEGWRTTSSTTPSPSGSSNAFIGWNT